MSYIWQDFNIKPFPAETIVFRDGLFCPEISTLESPVISKNYDLPVHYIYVGNLSGHNVLNIDINENVKNQKIFLSVNVKTENITDFEIVIKNSGMDSNITCFIVLENYGNLTYNIYAHHLCRKTGILVKNRLVAYKNSVSKLNGVANIYKYCEDCNSNIEFSAMAEKDAKIIFSPQQKISAEPGFAAHSANIARPNDQQIEYLHTAGLTDPEILSVMREAFINNTDF